MRHKKAIASVRKRIYNPNCRMKKGTGSQKGQFLRKRLRKNWYFLKKELPNSPEGSKLFLVTNLYRSLQSTNTRYSIFMRQAPIYGGCFCFIAYMNSRQHLYVKSLNQPNRHIPVFFIYGQQIICHADYASRSDLYF